MQFHTDEDNNIKHYIGQLIDFHESADIFSLSFLRDKSGKFHLPNVDDVTKVSKKDI